MVEVDLYYISCWAVNCKCTFYIPPLVFSTFKEALEPHFNLLVYLWVPSQIIEYTHRVNVLPGFVMKCDTLFLRAVASCIEYSGEVSDWNSAICLHETSTALSYVEANWFVCKVVSKWMEVTPQMGLNLKHLVSDTIWYDRINYHKSNVDVLFRTSAMK